MTDWKLKARGLWIEGDTLITDKQLVGMNFLIAKYGDQFHDNVQVAYNNKLPCIMFYENRPDTLVNAGLDPTHWPDSGNPCLIEVKEAVGKRIIQGIIIDCSITQAADLTTLTVPWIVKTGMHLIDRLRIIYPAKPIYMYMNSNPFSLPGLTENDKTMLGKFVEDYGVSTATIVTCDANMIPVSTTKPTLPWDNGKTKWNFWLYAVKVARVMYALSAVTVTELYANLKFTGGSDPIPPTEDDDDSVQTQIIILQEQMLDLQERVLYLEQIMEYHKLLLLQR